MKHGAGNHVCHVKKLTRASNFVFGDEKGRDHALGCIATSLLQADF